MNLASMLKAGHAFKPVIGTVPALVAAGTRNGPAIDRATPGGVHYSSLTLHTATGATAGAPTTQAVDSKLQTSGDGATGWADYVPPGETAAAAVAQITAASSNAEVDVNLEGAKRFIRVVETVAFTGGTAPTIGVSSTVILAGADRTPV